jgi:hypothetical protein
MNWDVAIPVCCCAIIVACTFVAFCGLLNDHTKLVKRVEELEKFKNEVKNADARAIAGLIDYWCR